MKVLLFLLMSFLCYGQEALTEAQLAFEAKTIQLAKDTPESGFLGLYLRMHNMMVDIQAQIAKVNALNATLEAKVAELTALQEKVAQQDTVIESKVSLEDPRLEEKINAKVDEKLEAGTVDIKPNSIVVGTPEVIKEEVPKP